MEEISNTTLYLNYNSLNNSYDTGEESISNLTNTNKIIKISTELNGNCKSKSQPKKLNSIKLKRPENTPNSLRNFCKSKTFEPKSSNINLLFHKILTENVPVIAKITHISKNDTLSKILNKIDFNIDNRTFLRVKYNRRKGVLYIKFRNKIYYNYYYFHLNKKHYHKGLPCVNMTKVEDNINIWNIDPISEEKKIFNIIDQEKQNNFFYSIIYEQYKDYNI